MLDYQLIPIIVFVVLLIPPIIFAFFRGWKATLVITLVTFALFGIVVGISFAIYDVAIWSVYRDLFIDVPQGLDPDAMSNASKPSAIILVVGVSSPIIYGLTMGLYKPFKKLLARHLEPKTTKIDKNSKTVSRTSNVVSRTSGVLIASVASLFVASTIASAASTVSTKYSKNNGFNKFLSGVGSIYTMGQGHYDEPFMILQDFAKNDLKGPEIQALYSLLALGD
ncbi:MAG: hypothetical protein KAG91_02825, partial [Mycoplasmataceae bacterium]|nr:hypothetical protein [Mycoplasmataceae bacterium]